jgi:hypothetical protein
MFRRSSVDIAASERASALSASSKLADTLTVFSTFIL